MIPVFFSPKQSTPAGQRFSPSAGKPAIVADALVRRGFPVRFVKPRGLLFSELARVHSPVYVQGVLLGRISNGFGDRDMAVARTLPFTSGSMLGAALAATPTMPACSLSSGFHHACYSHGGGFCTFNGLMAAAASLLATGKARRVAILDCDAHYGNGTDDILTKMPDYAANILHITIGRTITRHGAYIDATRRALVRIADFLPDVVLYQAGADPHECDPLGGDISTEEMATRDRMVFEVCKDFALPVAWNLAGGYQKGGETGIDPVLALHLNTFREACRVYGLPIPAEMKVPSLTPRPGATRNLWDPSWEDTESVTSSSARRATNRRSERTMFDLDRF